MNEVLVTYLPLPHTVRGLVTPTPDGDYRVVLNSRLSAQQQRDTYDHELRHILENHFSRDGEPVAQLEETAGERGRLQSIIEKVEEQGLPLPRPKQSGAAQNTQIKCAPAQNTGVQSSAVKTSRERQKVAAPTGNSPQTALLRARRAQLTGHWY